MSGTVRRTVSVQFDGLPTLKSVLTELHRAEKYIPEWMRLDDIQDNRSTDPDLREVAFIFRWDDR